MTVTRAFLLTRQWQDTSHGIKLELWFSSDTGPVLVEIEQQQTIFFILQTDISLVTELLSRLNNVQIKPLQLKSFNFEDIAGVYFSSQQQLYRARDILQKNDIRCFESDIRPAERFLTERFITGPVKFNTNNHRPNKALKNPKLLPSEYIPQLTALSLDIETAYDSNELYSIAFVSKKIQRVLMIGNDNNSNNIEYLENEKSLLMRFLYWVETINPDIFIGWNVVNFDFRFLQKKADQHRVPLNLGRNKNSISWRQAQTDTGHYFLHIPGRIVLDGIDTLKSATYQFSSFSLDSVGQQLLGRGKLIQADNKQDPLYKAKEIKHLFHNDKTALAAYNLEDCQLVWDIFEHTDLINFAIERARLTGLEMNRSGGSVAAFDNLYLPRLHRKGFVAPNIGDYHDQLSAPGGYVMNSKPGLHNSVIVLDYKSLYPSIIRTFKVDPYARIAAKNTRSDDIIPGFNGATFSKKENILPAIIEQLWQARDKAKHENNNALSQAIKIIMNSFYGVLGTPGCRVHDARLTSSITKRSHQIIKQTVKLIDQQGYTVIYGDTDSVFVSLEKQVNNEDADKIGKQLVDNVNSYWKNQLQLEFGIESFLEMEYETHFIRFFMPTIRGSEKGSKKRYAGLIKNTDGTTKIVFKGLETVRTDWTELARSFQQTLYKLIFNNQSFEDYIRQTVCDLKQGKLDQQLTYRKRLRQKLSDYKKNIPPHARAAIKAESIFHSNGSPSLYKNTGWIEYVITVHGPETLECQTSPLDYEHYIDKQLTPIADTILNVIGHSMTPIIQNQKELF
ncbi:MAG: DNA polymerase II [Gammaproteobacteria bacterium]|nr:DNA polymerase II [Gammaproteobacteria bacterium]